MKDKDIEELLNNYFEGETTCEEERRLRRFFTEDNVPEHLLMYRPIFAFMKADNDLHHLSSVKVKRPIRKIITYGLGGIAAGLLLLLGISGIYRHQSATPDNYVIIDGKMYTDSELVREQAVEAFREVCLTDEDVFNTLFKE